MFDAIVILSFLKCHGDRERSLMTGRKQMFGTSLKKPRKQFSKYELVSLTSISKQIVNTKDVKVTGNRR